MTKQEVTRLGTNYKKVSESWKKGKCSWNEVEEAYKKWEEAKNQLFKEKGWAWHKLNIKEEKIKC